MPGLENVHSKRTSADYTDYRDFLSDFWERRQKNSRLSFESAARRLKTSKSYLKMVLSKKRHIGPDKVIPLAKLFKMEAVEREYFYFLFLFTTTKEKELKGYLRAILQRYQINFKLQTSQEAPEEWLEIFNEWPRLLLHNLARLTDFKWTPEWVRSRLILSVDAVSVDQKIMQDLLGGGVITKEGEKYLAKNFVLRQTRGMERATFSQLMRMFLQKGIGYSQAAEVPQGPSGSVLMPLSKERYKKACALMTQMQRDLHALSSEDPAPEEIYYMTLYCGQITHGLSEL